MTVADLNGHCAECERAGKLQRGSIHHPRRNQQQQQHAERPRRRVHARRHLYPAPDRAHGLGFYDVPKRVGGAPQPARDAVGSEYDGRCGQCHHQHAQPELVRIARNGERRQLLPTNNQLVANVPINDQIRSVRAAVACMTRRELHLERTRPRPIHRSLMDPAERNFSGRVSALWNVGDGT